MMPARERLNTKPIAAAIKPGFGGLMVVIFLCLGCYKPLEQIKLVNNQTRVPDHKVILFFLDGVRNTLYEEMLAEGELPYIKKYFVDRGCRVENAFTEIPTITYAITTTFATGLEPGHHGILGNKFFDRDQQLFIDFTTPETYRHLDKNYFAPNLYEILQKDFSVSIQTPLRRGAYRNIDNWATSGVCWFFGWYESVNNWAARRFELIGEIARKVDRWPGLIFAYFPGSDEIGHRCGPFSQRYKKSLEKLDEELGKVCQALERNGLLEGTYLFLVSDHGMVATQPAHYVDVKKLLEEKFTLHITDNGPEHQTNYSDRVAYFSRYDAVLVNGGGRRVALHLKDGDDWQRLATEDQVRPIAKFLAATPGIDAVAYRGPGGVIIENQHGRALIERQSYPAHTPLNEKLYRYQIIDGSDPLGYALLPQGEQLADGQFHDGGYWLRETAQSRYPDVPVQIAEVFDSRRCGDLVIFAADNCGFGPENAQGGHGGILDIDMQVPMVIAGPGIKPGSTVGQARNVDVAPTIIDMIDQEKLSKYDFDGQSLLPQLTDSDSK